MGVFIWRMCAAFCLHLKMKQCYGVFGCLITPPLRTHKHNSTLSSTCKKVRLTSVFFFYGRMQLTLHATGRTPHGASRLVLVMSAWSVKTRGAPSRLCRDARVFMVIRLWPCMMSTPLPPPNLDKSALIIVAAGDNLDKTARTISIACRDCCLLPAPVESVPLSKVHIAS